MCVHQLADAAEEAAADEDGVCGAGLVDGDEGFIAEDSQLLTPIKNPATPRTDAVSGGCASLSERLAVDENGTRRD